MQAGADPNPQDVKGATPLFAAIIIRRDGSEGLDIARLLLSWGADPLLPNKEGFTPMHHSAGHGDTDMIDLLFAVAPAVLNVGTVGQGTTPLGAAVGTGMLSLRDRERTVRHLLAMGATDKAVSMKGACALIRAVRRVDEVSSKKLLVRVFNICPLSKHVQHMENTRRSYTPQRAH